MPDISADAVVWAPTANPEAPLVLLLHGFGSNERDLLGLVPELPSSFRYASLRAPLPVPSGFSWFPLSVDGGRLSASGGREAALSVARWAAEADARPVGVIGFSQGGALALELLREQAPGSLQWAAVLSGFVLEPDAHSGLLDERDEALRTRAPRVFWGRGDADPVISPDLVARTLRWLPEHSTAQLELYPGLSHSVSFDEIGDLSRWMNARAAE